MTWTRRHGPDGLLHLAVPMHNGAFHPPACVPTLCDDSTPELARWNDRPLSEGSGLAHEGAVTCGACLRVIAVLGGEQTGLMLIEVEEEDDDE